MAYEFTIPKATSLEFDKPVVFNENDKKAEPFCFLQTFREMAWKNLKQQKYEAALRNFNIVMGLHPTDIRSVTGRAMARAALTLYEGGQKDAIDVLKQDEFNAAAINIQALCEFELSNFEEGLIMYHRGMNKRGPRVEFREGRYQCEGTLEDTIGRFAGPMLTNMRHDIKRMLEMEEKARLAELNKVCTFVDTLGLEDPHPCTDFEWERYIRWLERLNNVRAEMYLGKLVYDKKWIKQTLVNPNVTNKMKEMLDLLMQDIDKRQVILWERRPLYNGQVKLEPYKVGLERNKRKSDAERALVMKSICGKYIKEIRRQRYLKNTRFCSDMALVLKKYLMNCPSRLLKDKVKISKLNTLIVGLAYLDVKKYRPHLTREENYERVSKMLGIDPEFNAQNIDSLIQECPFPFMDYKRNLIVLQDFLDTASIKEERAWLFFEKGRNYQGMQSWQHIVLLGKKCREMAEKCDSYVWFINGAFMEAVGMVRERNKEDALNRLERASAVAMKHNNQAVGQFLAAAIDIVTKKEIRTILLSQNQIENQKQDELVSLIEDEDKKVRLLNLFADMRTLPADRRMTILPGMQLKNEPNCNTGKKSIKRGGSGGRLSVHTLGQTTFDEFMED